jgi:hypothetical protein
MTRNLKRRGVTTYTKGTDAETMGDELPQVAYERTPRAQVALAAHNSANGHNEETYPYGTCRKRA